jgi:hypothetical protein
MALQLLAHIVPREAPALRRRASRIAAELEQDDLAGYSSQVKTSSMPTPKTRAMRKALSREGE